MKSFLKLFLFILVVLTLYVSIHEITHKNVCELFDGRHVGYSVNFYGIYHTCYMKEVTSDYLFAQANVENLGYQLLLPTVFLSIIAYSLITKQGDI